MNIMNIARTFLIVHVIGQHQKPLIIFFLYAMTTLNSELLPSHAPPCTACKTHPSKYRCPRCEARTCSLACSKQHKESTGCNGIRDRTGYIRMDKYGYKEMISDYSFLTDISNTKFDLTHAMAQSTPSFGKRAIGKTKMLKKWARMKGVELVTLSAGMKRRRVNCTRYNPRQKTFTWTLEVQFLITNEPRIVLLHRNSETSSLLPIIERQVNAYKNELGAYKDTSPQEWVIGLRREFGSMKRPHYFQLHPTTAPISDLLRGSKVLEYPTLGVWPGREHIPANIVLEDAQLRLDEAPPPEENTTEKEKEEEEKEEEEEEEEEVDDEDGVLEVEGESKIEEEEAEEQLVEVDFNKIINALHSDLGDFLET